MIKPRDAPVGAADARETMRFIREAYELRFHASALEGNKSLLALFDRATMIVLVVDDKRGRTAFAEILDR